MHPVPAVLEIRKQGSVSEHYPRRDTYRQLFRLQHLYGEDARYPDGTADPFQTQWGHLSVVAVLKTHAKSCQEGCPCKLRKDRALMINNSIVKFVCSSYSSSVSHVHLCHLEHGPDMLQVSGAGERSLDMADCLHKSFGSLGHLFHLHVVQQTPLLLTSHTWVRTSTNSFLQKPTTRLMEKITAD